MRWGEQRAGPAPVAAHTCRASERLGCGTQSVVTFVTGPSDSPRRHLRRPSLQGHASHRKLPGSPPPSHAKRRKQASLERAYHVCRGGGHTWSALWFDRPKQTMVSSARLRLRLRRAGFCSHLAVQLVPFLDFVKMEQRTVLANASGDRGYKFLRAAACRQQGSPSQGERRCACRWYDYRLSTCPGRNEPDAERYANSRKSPATPVTHPRIAEGTY